MLLKKKKNEEEKKGSGNPSPVASSALLPANFGLLPEARLPQVRFST